MNTTSAISDTDLLRAMRGGAADAFAALYRRHQGPLYRFALLRCGSEATAADVVQEAGPDGGDDDPESELPLDDGGPLARLLDNEAAEQVRRALAHLAPHYRDVVILYEMHELSYAEIADICQVDIGTVRSRLSRGRAALAKRLAGWRAAPDLAQA
jgi:RNA polymerase sigma-70 factor (ECF subfamily)